MKIREALRYSRIYRIIEKALSYSSVRDFSILFFSKFLQIVFGLIREIIIASVFGSALIYANYLLLRTVADFFSQFTVGNALKANLLPKFTKVLEKYNQVSLSKVFNFSKKTMLLLFVLTQIIQFFIIWYLDTDYTLKLILISVLLSISISFNFLNTIYLTFIQAQGKFFKYSLATTLNSFLVVVLVKPLTLLCGVIGLALSRLFGILSITIFYVLPMNSKKEGFEVELSRKDFNFPTLILGNFANIIILSSRFVSGSDGGNGIAYFTYSVFILNAFLTSVVGNISTLLLRKVSIKKNNMFMFYSFIISIVVGISLVLGLEFYGFDIIKLVYMRGEFNMVDVEQTTEFIKHLSYCFIMIFIATTLFQPFFSLDIISTRKVRRVISLIFILTIVFGILFTITNSKFGVITESIIVMYSSSVISVLLSVYSYYYYLNNYDTEE
jgi:peptidoglycan biosynthesis protein MviN/MurJ (putative lipid II flippase)